MRTGPAWPTMEPATRASERRLKMYWDHMDGWDWLWATFMMGVWVVLLGAVIYIAVRLAQGDRHGKSQP